MQFHMLIYLLIHYVNVNQYSIISHPVNQVHCSLNQSEVCYNTHIELNVTKFRSTAEVC